MPYVTEYGSMTPWFLTLRRATANHQETVIGLIEDAASWLRTRGTDQWARPWPTRHARDSRILADLQARRTWIGWDNGVPAATITVDTRPNLAWPDDFRKEPAVYIHRLVVSRPYASFGLGGELLDWAARKAWRDHGALWMRLNAWTTNLELHDYYQKRGFEFCGRSSDDGYPSAIMFQRSTEDTGPARPTLFWERPNCCC
jgi:GNAT superfamily N-acetyltransferase